MRHFPAAKSTSVFLVVVTKAIRELTAHRRRRLLPTPNPLAGVWWAGVNVYDSQTEAKVGGVVIECDLERILRDHLQTASPRIRDVVLTDSEGHVMMHFARGRRLRAVDQIDPSLLTSASMKQFFQVADAHDVLLTSPNVCVAKVSLDPYRTERCMGLIVLFDP